MHNKFRTAVTSGVGREENRTKKGVTGNFHTNWAVLFLMLSGGYKLLVGSCSNFAHLKFFFDKSIGNNCANILFLTRQWFGSGTYCICWHSFSFTKKRTLSQTAYIPSYCFSMVSSISLKYMLQRDTKAIQNNIKTFFKNSSS